MTCPRQALPDSFLILSQLHHSDHQEEWFAEFKIISWNLVNYLRVSPGERTWCVERTIGNNSGDENYVSSMDFGDVSNQRKVTSSSFHIYRIVRVVTSRHISPNCRELYKEQFII